MSQATALVLVLNDAAAFDAVRREFAPWDVERRIPFHITLLFPFAARDEVTDELLGDVSAFFAGRPAFAFALTRIAFWPRVVYAVPEPDGQLVECMRALYARFPQWSPYGGIHDEVVPHATLGHEVDGPTAQPEIERRLVMHLPKRYLIDEVTLLEEYAPDRWRERERFPLGG